MRAANTGISAVIDPLGRIIKSLPLGTEGVIDAPLPRAIAPTSYADYGDYAVILFMVVSLLALGAKRCTID